MGDCSKVYYAECQKAHEHLGGKIDGCQEFRPMSKMAENCSICGCHMNFHKKVVEMPPVRHVTEVVYTECHKNHRLEEGSYAKDGCREFKWRKNYDNYPENTCAACGCHQSFHRNEVTHEESFSPSDESDLVVVIP